MPCGQCGCWLLNVGMDTAIGYWVECRECGCHTRCVWTWENSSLRYLFKSKPIWTRDIVVGYCSKANATQQWNLMWEHSKKKGQNSEQKQSQLEKK
jgi:hypothetical protein